MDRKLTQIVTASLALMMTTTSLYAGPAAVPPAQSGASVILAQAECDPNTDPDGCKPRARRQQPQGGEEQPARPRRQQQSEQPAGEEPAARPRRQQQSEQPAAEQPAPRPRRQQQQEAPAAEQPAAPAEQPAPRPRRNQPQPEAPAAEQPAAPAEQPAPRPRRNQPQPESPAAEQPAAPAEQPAPRPRRNQPQPETPAAEQPTAPAEQPAPRPRRNQPQTETPAAEQPTAPAEQPAPRPRGNQPQTETPATEQPAGTEQPAPRPRQPQPAPDQTETAPNDGAEAPVLDSQKERPARGQNRPSGGPRSGNDRDQGGQGSVQPRPSEPAAPPPRDDRAAQERAQPTEIVPVTRERGTRRQTRPERPSVRGDRPEGVEVLREIGDRAIIHYNNQIIVRSDEAPRMGRGAREVYYEDLSNGRTREVIMRPNGTQVVTIRNRYGDVIRRSRIMPDGREYILTYVDDRDLVRVREWRDPGLDLPPMVLTVPVRDYIYEAERAQSPDDYYEFLREPPVEPVKRLYSVDEVKRSARVRDIARRIDLDTIKFAFGKADVPESEITRLEGVANAMNRLLKANPAETFLIEGHTDAVGSEEANLALSDRRAEAVADALTDVFGIPPENLSTQGYGEEYLKVRTQEPNQENRRVAIRRITPLVAPVASAN